MKIRGIEVLGIYTEPIETAREVTLGRNFVFSYRSSSDAYNTAYMRERILTYCGLPVLSLPPKRTLFRRNSAQEVVLAPQPTLWQRITG